MHQTCGAASMSFVAGGSPVLCMVGYSPISLHSDVAGVQWHFHTELHDNDSIPRNVRCRVSSTRNAGDGPRTPCHLHVGGRRMVDVVGRGGNDNHKEDRCE